MKKNRSIYRTFRFVLSALVGFTLFVGFDLHSADEWKPDYDKYGNGTKPEQVDNGNFLDGIGDVRSVEQQMKQAIPDKSVKQYSDEIQVDSLVDACQSKYKQTKIACAGQSYAPIIAMMLPGLAGGSGNVKESCEKAANYAKSGTLLNGAVIGICQGLRYQCLNACEQVIAENSGVNQAQVAAAQKSRNACDKMEMEIMTMVLSLAQAVQTLSTSSSCSSLAGDDELFKCSQNQDAMKDPAQCPAVACNLAVYPQNRENEACNNLSQGELAQLCQGAQAHYNPLCQSYCAMNPTACTGDGGNGDGINQNALNSGESLNGFGIGGLDDEYEVDNTITGGNPNQQAAGLAKGSGGGGGGGGLGGGGGAAGSAGLGGEGGSGQRAGGLDTDVFRNASGGAGGSAGGGSGGGGYESAGGAWKKTGGSGSNAKMQNIDFRKFLPGGAKDPKRNPANAQVQLQSLGITQANGLSNFQKVTRMLNKKKTELNP